MDREAGLGRDNETLFTEALFTWNDKNHAKSLGYETRNALKK